MMIYCNVAHGRQLLINTDQIISAIPDVGDDPGVPTNGRVSLLMASGCTHTIMCHWSDFVKNVKAEECA